MALGLVLVGTTVIVSTDASRDAYHAHLYQQALQKRGARRFTAPQRTRSIKIAKQQDYTGRPTTQNLRYPSNKRNIYSNKTQNDSNRALRPMSKTIGYPTTRTSREVLRVKNLDPMYISVRTIMTEDFSVEIPKGWNPKVEDGVLRVGDADTFAITIRRAEDVCENVSFQSCAINVSNDLNHLENVGAKINSLGHVTRLTQNTDRTLGTNKYTQTHTESFLGTYLGRDVFVSRYFIEEPNTDNVFIIETIADRQLASEAVVVAKRLTKSFRMITQ